MPAGYTFTLISSIAMLAAMDVPFPVEMTALVMVGLVLRWALGRQNRAHDQHDQRLRSIEQQLANEQDKKDMERSLKHAWRNEVATMRATIGVMLPVARGCSCGTMDSLMPVLERLVTEIHDPEAKTRGVA